MRTTLGPRRLGYRGSPHSAQVGSPRGMNTTSPRPPTTFQQSTVARAPSKPSRVSSKASWLRGNGHKGIDGDEGFEHREPRPSLRLRQPEPDPDLTRTDHLAPDCHIDGVPPALFGSGLSAAIQSAMQVTCVLRLPRQRNSTIQRRSRADLITHLRFPCAVPERARLRGSSVFRRLERNVHARAQSGL